LEHQKKGVKGKKTRHRQKKKNKKGEDKISIQQNVGVKVQSQGKEKRGCGKKKRRKIRQGCHHTNGGGVQKRKISRIQSCHGRRRRKGRRKFRRNGSVSKKLQGNHEEGDRLKRANHQNIKKITRKESSEEVKLSCEESVKREEPEKKAHPLLVGPAKKSRGQRRTKTTKKGDV